MGAFTTMTSKGQLTVPKEVRDRLNLSVGTRFYVMERNGHVVAIPKNKSLSDLAGLLGSPPNGAKLSVEDMNDAVAEAVAEDHQRIMREWKE
ncbi:MAG: AbrB/MazE/SpoVT family DNA-binding domain-containing protein [Hyphomicrobiales bacterium]|nr:MAG: AbrB/MazE/SpoVT family DNA-binding domain-containing protein [Hyphomicrobiales bacterium]